MDANFVISCIKKRIDFIEQLHGLGFKIAVPREVLEELKDLRNKQSVSRDGKVVLDVALELLARKDIKKMRLGTGSVDKGLIKKGKEGVYIASLDRAIKREVFNRVIIFDSRKSVGIDRD